MKYCLSCFTFLIVTNSVFSQNNFELSGGIDFWQRNTVSIGNIGQKNYKNKLYPYYNVLGTGVICYINIRDTPFAFIVTAKHVIRNKKKEFLDTIRVRFSWESEKSVYENLGYRIVLREGRNENFFMLPDSTIDLVCIPLVVLDTGLNRKGFFKVMPYGYFASDQDYFEGREIYTLGYPSGIGSNYWTRGLLRKGIISWLPDTGLESKKFIVDCNIYPGNSGGPVFSLPSYAFVEKMADTAVYNPKFFGIVIQRRLDYNDVIGGKDSAGLTDSLRAPESMGVGIVEPAKNVRKLLSYTEEMILEEINNVRRSNK